MKKQFFSKFMIITILLFSLINIVFSSYYADISIIVNKAGDVNIDGKTDYNKFLNIKNSPEFTSKNGGIWTLNISSNQDEIFNNFIYELTLPENSQINYMKTTPNFRIENTGSKIKIIGTGNNKPFTILVQYKVNQTNIFSSENILIWFFGIFFLIIIFVIIYFGYKILNKENKNIEKEIESVIEDSTLINPEHKLKIKKYDVDSFPERQKTIIQLLKSKNGLTQDEIGEIMKIPKSSLSRNIKSLEIKKIVSITSYGRYNKIELNEKKLE